MHFGYRPHFGHWPNFGVSGLVGGSEWPNLDESHRKPYEPLQVQVELSVHMPESRPLSTQLSLQRISVQLGQRPPPPRPMPIPHLYLQTNWLGSPVFTQESG